MTPSMKEFIRKGISEFKEHELREIVAVFCKLPGIMPQPERPVGAPRDSETSSRPADSAGGQNGGSK